MTAPTGEMPFLDHLEELRSRILRSLGGIIVGFAIGLWSVERFQLVSVLKRPIAPYLIGGKLTVLSPTEPVMIVFKLGFIIGLVLALPVIVYQVWAFLSPALYAKERRAVVPALFVGTLLFLAGATVAYEFVLPQALRVLFSFQSEAIAPMITYGAYFDFVLQIVLALGISFELPLVIVILAVLGVITPVGLSRFRRYAIVLACIAGALLSPGADLFSMLMMTIPLLLLYEVGFAGAVVVHRRRQRAAAATALLALLLCAGATGASAQQRPGADTTRVIDSARADGTEGADSTEGAGNTEVPPPGQSLDTATARRMGLPTEPSRTFAEDDSVIRALMSRPGYDATRYRADSATLFADERRIRLEGAAMTRRQGATLEADSISYDETSCLLDAVGEPRLFDQGQVLVGQGVQYDTCRRRGVVREALTNFKEGGSVWFLRGDVAADSTASRIYAGSGELTSCDLPVPHYHFAARKIKWISKTVLVARPVVLYVRDVPILWLPFIFQDLRAGRRSGVLVPRFGISDLVRPSGSYNRQITNLGYYWAPNEYIDLTGRIDWYSRRYVQLGVSGQYRWLDRFMEGSLGVSRQIDNGGGSSNSIRWDHRQTFDLSTSLNFDLNYISNTSIVQQNAVDPRLNTQQISSSANFSKRYRWGTVSLGGNRRQSLSDNSATQQLPALSISPAPLDIGRNITWSPGLRLTNDQTFRTPLADILVTRPDGGVDTIAQTGGTRVTALNFDTPIRIGSFDWRNAVNVVDQTQAGRQALTFRTDDPTTPDPTDSITVTRVVNGAFSTGIDWDTGINLPILFRSKWKIQPSLGIANTTGGPFALRNQNTGGAFVTQGKRFALTLTSNPTFFGFYPGIGPVQRIRHSITPIVSFNYAPAASVPEDYARAIAAPGQPLVLRSLASQTISLGLSQNIEGKGRPAPNDTLGTSARKFRLLSINTSPFGYDFEQAKQPGQTGWTTQTITNSFLSDVLPSFNLSVTHDLWRGRVGADSARFAPFLQSVSASFSISSRTFGSVLRLVGLGEGKDHSRNDDGDQPYNNNPGAFGGLPGTFFSSQQLGLNRDRGITANVNYSLSRTRTPTGVVTPPIPTRQNLSFTTAFSPTAFWSLAWSAQYNITDGRFESQDVRLERDLHEWRAGFNFVRNANGNVAFFFSISLTDLPELKFDYNQSTIER